MFAMASQLAALPRYIRNAGFLLLTSFLALFSIPTLIETDHHIALLRIFRTLALLVLVWVLAVIWVAIKFRFSVPKSLFVLLPVFIAGAVVFSSGDLMFPFPAHVTVDGRAVADTRVYRGWNGEITVFLSGEKDPHVYVPAAGDVFYCSQSMFVDYRVFGWQEDGALCMPSIKEEVPLDLRVKNNELSFNVPQAYKPQGMTARVTVRR
jgi:hypothetical protein